MTDISLHLAKTATVLVVLIILYATKDKVFLLTILIWVALFLLESYILLKKLFNHYKNKNESKRQLK